MEPSLLYSGRKGEQTDSSIVPSEYGQNNHDGDVSHGLYQRSWQGSGAAHSTVQMSTQLDSEDDELMQQLARAQARETLVEGMNPNSVDENEYRTFVQRWRTLSERRPGRNSATLSSDHPPSTSTAQRSFSTVAHPIGRRRYRPSLRKSIIDALQTVSSRVASSQPEDETVFAIATGESRSHERDSASSTMGLIVADTNLPYVNTEDQSQVSDEEFRATIYSPDKVRYSTASYQLEDDVGLEDEQRTGGIPLNVMQNTVTFQTQYSDAPTGSGTGVDHPDLMAGNTAYSTKSEKHTTKQKKDHAALTHKGARIKHASYMYGDGFDKRYPPLGGYSLGIFGPRHPLRVWLARRLQSRWFEVSILFLVILNCIVLALDARRFDNKPKFGDSWFDYVLFVIFILYTIEIIAKIIVFGFIVNPPPPSTLIRQRTTHRRASDGPSPYSFQGSSKSLGIRDPEKDAMSGSISGRLRQRSSHTGLKKRNAKRSQQHGTGDTPVVSPFPSPAGSAAPSPVHSDVSDHEPDDQSEWNGMDEHTRRQKSRKNYTSAQQIRRWIMGKGHEDASNTKTGARRPKVRPLHNAYLRHTFNRIDFLAVVCYWIDFVFMIMGVTHFPLFKALAALRPMRLLAITSGLATIMKAIKISMPLLANVVGFIAFFALLFGLIALQTFKGTLARRCEVASGIDAGTISVPEKFCGSHQDQGGRIFGIDGHTLAKGYTCPVEQRCVVTDENPHHGFISYDNIVLAVFTIFNTVSMEGWTEIMYWTMDAEYKLAALYHCMVILIMSFIMIQLFVAVITESFADTRAQSQASTFLGNSRETQLLKYDGHEVDAAEAAAERIRLEMEVLHGEGRRLTLVRRLRNWFVIAVHHKIFQYIGGFLIVASIGIMATRTWRSDPSQIRFIESAEAGFTIYFAIEIVMRIMAAESWSSFWKKHSNRVDVFIAVATSVIQLPIVRQLTWYRYLTVFNVLRFYRVVPLVPRINVMAAKMFRSIRAFVNVILFMAMTLTVASIIAMQLFRGRFDFDDYEEGEVVRNFDSFGEAYLSLFQILSGENWNEILYNAMRSQTGIMIGIAGLCIIIFFWFSNYVIVNLFVAVLLENFEMDTKAKRAMQIAQFLQRQEQEDQYTGFGFLRKLNPYLYMKPKPRLLRVNNVPKGIVAPVRKSLVRRMISGTATETQGMPDSSARETNSWTARLKRRIYGNTQDISMEEITADTGGGYLQRSMLSTNVAQPTLDAEKEDEISGHKRHESMDLFSGNPDETKGDLRTDGDDFKMMKKATQKQHTGTSAKLDARAAREAEFREDFPTYERSLFLFYPESRIRQFCRRLVGTRESRAAGKRTWFDWFIILSIIGSIVVVVIDTPLYRRNLRHSVPPKTNIYPWLDAIFLFIFVVELLIRACADGFLFTPQAYLLDPWNRLDLLIVFVLAIGFPINATASGGLERAFRTTRASRPLRLINQFPSVKEIFRSTLISVPNILYTAALSIMFVIPFAVYGVNIFAGYFAQCNDKSVTNQAECVGEFLTEVPDTEIKMLVPRVWSNPYQYSFDSFGSAMLLLFEMASREGWVDVLATGMSVPSEPGLQARYSPTSASWYNAIFFCVFMLFGSIVVVQIFIGIIVETLRVRSGLALLTIDQQRWMDLKRRLKLIRPTAMPPRPSGKFRGWCYDVSIDKRGKLSFFINIVTVINLIVMMTEHRGQPAWLDTVKDYYFTALTIIYIMEIFIKIYGQGWRKWSKNRWNIIELFQTTGAAVTDLCIFFNVAVPTMMQAQKFFLVLVAVRLIQRIDSLQTLFKMLLASVPSIFNISIVLMMVLVIYSIVLVELFSLTRFGPYTDELASFRTFGNTLLMLFRMTTGENWHYVMHDIMVEPPYCVGADDYLDTDCGSKYWALFLMLSFYIIGTYILVNMFIVAVIDNFSYTYHRDIRASFVTRSDIRRFKRVWAQFDPQATGYIHPDQLPRLLRSLTGSFSMRIYDSDFDINVLKRRVISKPKRGDAVLNPVNDMSIELRRINRVLAAMDVTQVRERRRRYNLVYQELMMSKTERGIAFRKVLQVLAYNMIDIEKCLKIDELIVRQRQEEQLLERAAYEKVVGILRTLVQRRRYRAQLRDAQEKKAASAGGLHPDAALTSQSRLNVPSSSTLRTDDNVLHPRQIPGRRNIHRLSINSRLSADEHDGSDSDVGSPMPGPLVTSMFTESQVWPGSSHDDRWHQLSSETVTEENANAVLHAVTNNVWFDIIGEEREREQETSTNATSSHGPQRHFNQ